jgi:hypothetical protein
MPRVACATIAESAAATRVGEATAAAVPATPARKVLREGFIDEKILQISVARPSLFGGTPLARGSGPKGPPPGA